MKEKYEPEVSIKGLSSEIMDLIMDFIYTCKINLTNENVFELLAASEQLQIPYIKDYCALLLHKIANRSNCIHIFMCARLYQLKTVVQKAEKILFENFESIVKEEQFNLLELEDVTALVKSNGQHVKEEDLYLALVAWVKHDRNQREQYFCRLFGNLSLCKLSKAFLKKVLVHECLVADCLDCSKALMKAVLEHAPEQQDADSQSSFVVMGGEGDEVTDIVTYNLMEKQCLIEQPFLHRKLPFGHTGASAVCIEKTVFLMGGGESLTEIIDTVKSFNAENKLSPWVKQPKMLKKRQYFSSAVINELIYVSGGLKPNAGSTASCEQFDTMSKVWSGMYNMIQERAFHGMVALNRKLYVAGGFGGGKRLSSAECYDPCSKRWKFVASMKEKRNELTLVVLNNRLFAIGGYNGQNRLSSMEIYNPLTDSWVNGAPLNISRSGACACVMKGKIYVVGGKNEQGPVLSVEVYDPALGNWEINCKLATPRMYSSIVTV
ncbi:kelch-like protein 38 isoform X2 [Clavelina lepadiformis]